MRVPLDLREQLGKRELKKPLKTFFLRSARVYAMLYAAKATEIFDVLRGAVMPKIPFP
jgi:hypothetical protein